MTTVLEALSALFTALAYITAAVLAITAILVLIEARNNRRKAAWEAKQEQRRRWAEMCAIAKLMEEQRNETFERAAWYGRIEDMRDAR